MLEIVGAPSLETFQKTDTRTLYAHPEQRKALIEVLRQKGRVDQFECTLRRIDGRTRQCLIHARAEPDPEGRVLLIQGVLRRHYGRTPGQGSPPKGPQGRKSVSGSPVSKHFVTS